MLIVHNQRQETELSETENPRDTQRESQNTKWRFSRENTEATQRINTLYLKVNTEQPINKV